MSTPIAIRPGPGREGFTTLDGEPAGRIDGYDRLPPFLISLPTDSDLWMFISSRGGLTAGRVSPDQSLFPYETVDKLHDAHHHTGAVTLFRVRREGAPEARWEPWISPPAGGADGVAIERNLYKNVAGNRLVFEEVNHDLGLAVRARWSGCDEFGWVRTVTLENLEEAPVSLSVLDGLRNVLPWGVPLTLLQQSSSLVDAYRRTDRDPETGLAVFSLTAKITDRPEAAEVLRANTVWACGLPAPVIAVDPGAVDAFRRGEAIPADGILTGRRGNYFAASVIDLEGRGQARWHLVADVGRTHVQIASLRARLGQGADLDRILEATLAAATQNLVRNVAGSDGLQLTADTATCAHHFANVLFNNMRGGVFDRNGEVPAGDFRDFVAGRNRDTAARRADDLDALPDRLPYSELLARAAASGDADYERLAHEYLPLWFGRRHGDPSRPWNRFSIQVRDRDGGRALRYEGNWRDIFQNWEALAESFPGFLPGFLAKFVNASTVDGFNPYRITREGIDWEVAEPGNPWSHIGYWGDHQIIYLLKFLEAQSRFFPGTLEELLGREIFSYADVPYRIRPYPEMVRNPRATIDYDSGLAAEIAERVRAVGADGKLVTRPDGEVHHVSLLEKLLVPALSKLSNLVPEGGIWMNTQRPEWNDANNALVGDGVSVVTLAYLRRYLTFLERLLDDAGELAVPVSREVADWFRRLDGILAAPPGPAGDGRIPDTDRKRILDALGLAFSDYRASVYSRGFSGKEPLAAPAAASFCRRALAHVDHALRLNRRADGLYHAYNLVQIDPEAGEARLRPLQLMLEGQVAVLSSGLVGPAEAARMVDALFESPLYRSDQRSFLLYPERSLPGFLDRNSVPEDGVRTVPLLSGLLAAGETSIVERDALGTVRFHGDFQNAQDLARALDRLAARPEWSALVAENRGEVLELFERVFNHRLFTGRSGTMYGYEGLGCIYWHMVAKLLLAVQEIALRAWREDAPDPAAPDLARAYYRIRSGLGFEKSAAEYGAFPTDPYSHTPRHAGAQQPGMTGQVKEEILTRFGELGVEVEGGRLGFRPALLRRSEFLPGPARFRVYTPEGTRDEFELSAGSLGFTFGQVPVIYRRTVGEPWIRVTGADGAERTVSGARLDPELSRSLFERRGEIVRIEVGVPEASLLDR